MRVLILGIDWHGDVAPALARGFRSIDVEARVEYVLRQRRRGVVARLHDELRAVKPFRPRLLAWERKSLLAATLAALDTHKPDLAIVLTPDLLPEEGLELVASRAQPCWWFGDDPGGSLRRGLAPSPLIQRTIRRDAVALVAHPDWATGALASATYLPYAGRFEPSEPAFDSRAAPTLGCVVVGSPRPARRRLLTELAPLLGDRLNIWGWGKRGRLPLGQTRGFRRRLRGWVPLDDRRLETVYRSAGVVLNLQDEQMLGAWNPQTFDLLGLGVPQVVWNENPIRFLENPPAFASSAEGLADLVAASLTAPDPVHLAAGFEEARRRHRWSDRAMAIVSLTA